MNHVIQLLRPHQWLKNFFIFLPLFFGRHLTDLDYIYPSILAFISFSLAASAIYCLNDVWDAEKDRLHPIKSRRPIACGALSKRIGYMIATICAIMSLILSYFEIWGGKFYLFAIILFYILMNIAYCIKLKQIAVVDVFVIATGFVLRVFAGGFATGIYLSHWIILMTFLLALFLAFAKRRDDVVMYENTGVKVRNNVNRYNLDFMNQAITVVGSITMVCYIMYTVSPEVMSRFQSSYIYVTVLFVLAGIIRYMQITIVDVKSGSPTKVMLNDHFVQACIVGWCITFAILIYV